MFKTSHQQQPHLLPRDLSSLVPQDHIDRLIHRVIEEIEENKQDYYLALRASQSSFGKKKETITPWISFFVDVLKKQAQQAKHLLTEESLETILSPKQLAVWQAIETRETISAGEISKKASIARPTVNQALEKLLSMKKIERIGIGRATRCRVRK